MKNTERLAAAVLTVLITASLCACSGNNSKGGSASSTASGESAAVSSQVISEGSRESSVDVSADESSSESSQEESVSEVESSVQTSDESGSVSSEEESTEPSEEVSDSSQGYCFDDEQIVVNYHTAKVFTDDEEFNALFAKNDIDKAYDSELRDIEDIIEMRKVTIRYADTWKAEQEKAYNKLYEMLAELPEEQEKLVVSQQMWVEELDETEASFRSEASDSGSYGLLAADSAMMNYYKGRAAVLYHQIYLLSGSFDMS